MKKSAEGFARVAREVFAPIYPVIAEQALAWSSIRDGIALDLGSGPGLLSVALAEKSNLTVVALDADPAMSRIARTTADGSAGRVIPVRDDILSSAGARTPFERTDPGSAPSGACNGLAHARL